MITRAASITAAILAAAALVVALTHSGPTGATGRAGPPGPQGNPGVAQNLDGGYTAECHQPMNTPDGTQITYYYPCSPVPQNPADQ